MATAMIWGASGGIGQALVAGFKGRDWRVIAVARDASRIPPEADLSVEFEANSPAAIATAIHAAAMETDAIDCCVYAAGSLAYNKVSDMTDENWYATLHSNLTGAFLVAQHSLPLLRQGGSMLFIGAYVEHLQLPKMAAYAAAKAGLAELVNVLAKENRRHRFAVVRPGAVDTPFWQQVSFKMPADAKAPQVVAEAIVDYASAGTTGDINL